MYERYDNNLLRIEGAEIWGLNFSGEQSRYNRAGDRNFCVNLDKELGKILEEEGWNIKWRMPENEGEEPDSAYVQIKVNFNVPNPRLRPRIYVISKERGTKTLINEEIVDAIDRYDIITNSSGNKIADIEVRPRPWSMDDGKSGVKAYLSEMYIDINESCFDRKYADFEEK